MLFATALLFAASALAQAPPQVAFHQSDARLDILIDGAAVATYVWNDPAIPRPYFCNVRTLDGIPVTRTQPPDPLADADNLDHPTFHPGIWLAFGDIGGLDVWRLKARVRHVRFLQAPVGGDAGRFTVVNSYEPLDDPAGAVCEETCAYTIHPTADGFHLLVRSVFRTDRSGIAFGDQEEMGLGVRIATPLSPKHSGGFLLSSTGGQGEDGTWGKIADWCAVGSAIGGRRVAAMLAPSPANFRPAWFHNRKSGFFACNPFGKKSMTAPKDDSVSLDSTPIVPGVPFHLGYGVHVFSAPETDDPAWEARHAVFVKSLAAETPLE